MILKPENDQKMPVAESQQLLESTAWRPLYAEAREKYSHWYKWELNPGCEGRAQFLYEQLKARPSPWGKGLWKDEETEKIAERCAQIFVENFLACPNERLIPQDPMEMVMALNDTGDLEDVEALVQIEREFSCKIPEECFQAERTFEEFVEYVKDGKGKTPPDAAGCLWGFGLLSVVLVVLPCYCAYRVYGELAIWLSEGWEQVEVGSLIGHSIGAVIGLCCGVPCVIRMLRKDKRITWKQV
mgnify:FL=1